MPNVEELAAILISEASVGNADERNAVGWTVLTRMQRRPTQSVRDVWGAYAHNQVPTAPYLDLATRLLAGQVPDPSGGATHYYSPRSMPMEGDSTVGFDVAGGLEQTPGLPRRNYRPGWATVYPARPVANARPAYFKFYQQPGSGPVV